MEDRIKQLRDNIDSLIDFNDVVKSKSTNAFIADVTLAFRHLQMAKGHLGKCLGCLGEPTPYTQADKVEDIPGNPTINEVRRNTFAKSYIDLNALQLINMTRIDIKNISDNVWNLYCFNDRTDVTNGKFDVHLVEAFKKLEEASMAYGFALRSMKDHFDKTNV